MDELYYKEVLKDELNIILNIYNYYIENTTANYYHNSVPVEILKSHIFINHDKYKTYLVYYQNDLIGFCYITRFRKKEAYYRTAEIGIYLKPEFAGMKFGEQIIPYLEKNAKSNQIKVLIASISNENSASIKLIEKMGYTKCAHYKEVAEKFGRILDVVDYQKIL